MIIIKTSKKSIIFLTCLVWVLENHCCRADPDTNDDDYISEEECPALPQNKDCHCDVMETNTTEIEGQHATTTAKYYSLSCISIREQKDLLEALRILTDAASYNISLRVKNSRFDFISDFAHEFEKMTNAGSKQRRPINIQSLSLFYNKFNSITPDAFLPLAQNLVSLSIFDSTDKPTLTGPKLDMLYEALKPLKNLETLDLIIPEEFEFDASYFENFPKLETLSLMLPNLLHLKNSKGFRSLTNLRELIITSKLPYLPKSIVSLPHLEMLYFYSSSLSTFQNDILSFGPELRELDLSSNHIDTIPFGTFQKMLKLEDLALSDNHLESLPPLCSPSPSIIDIAGEKNKDIAIERGGVHSGKAESKNNNLTRLDLSHNEFKDGSLTKETFASCTSLTELFLDDNHLSSLPGDMLDDSRNSLQELSFSENRLKLFPSSLLSKLNNLIYLSLGKNEIQNVPIFAFKNYRKLQYIYLNMNKLKEFNMNTLLSAKRSLSILDLSNNHLSSFDFQYLENFHNLTRLDLSYNNLTSVKGLLDTELIHHHIHAISLEGRHINYFIEVYSESNFIKTHSTKNKSNNNRHLFTEHSP
ncbi:unnamed protein product [Gordionus sp. m RMFG-2023]|uniref:protein artichoke-like n=1 Tax=Gordionus sp. m RMFG-2023 TaxID=3053472 RepID=UPI0030E57D44